ncbi:MAG: cobyrinate a,c-diamide synthase [Rhodospirillaceae bacterium]
MNGVLISALHKSSGKTTVTIGVAQALTQRGLRVQAFKKGPDYIDPMWLSLAAGRPCRNLDFHTMTAEELKAYYLHHGEDAEISVVEGNKGLYDGIDLGGADSNAELAKLLSVPVVLVIDTRGMTRGIAPVIQGYTAFDPEVSIAGVILNQVGGPRHESKLRAALEHYTDVPVIGAIGRHPELEIAERHLGLVPANEAGEALDLVRRAGQVTEAGVDIGLLGVIACMAEAPMVDRAEPARLPAPDLRIAVARDAAFGFYYPDDLEAMARAGAEIVPFDALTDAYLPDCDGLFIGGGFPETQAAGLEANAGLRADIRKKLAAGLPAYAECGGLMYLSRSLSWQGRRYEMVGAVPGDSVMHKAPVGRGYVRLEHTGLSPWPNAAAGGEVRVHEFHYASLDGLPANSDFAYAVKRGHGIDGRHDGLVVGNLLATFSHHRTIGGYDWVGRFLAFVRDVKSGAIRRRGVSR